MEKKFDYFEQIWTKIKKFIYLFIFFIFLLVLLMIANVTISILHYRKTV